ncbi:VgrG-related protein [Amycolatopsis sp. CA-230715]|uniref:VgrG-related protein n=1 Tax=Amycolatopsis sp. CA-230715 TaxID=2745196 RepID=UPI001C00E047|nr:VgrG-related protein [Amycolatopsis sp. CA-230715]QWF77828.1 hypothetical protein HUW46_01221 [Amycolatopsis sp. CA-230715]
MSQRAFTAEPVIKAPGELPEAWIEALVECTVDESVNLPATAVLAFRDPEHELFKETGITIGTTVQVSMITTADRGQLRLFSGEVTALEAERDATGTYSVVRATDPAHKLMRHRRVHAFRNRNAERIVREIAKRAGVAVGTVRAPGTPYDQISQANVTDWEFLRWLAAEHGAWLRIDDQGRLCFSTPKPASGAPSPKTTNPQEPLVLRYGESIRSLRAVLSTADQVGKVTVRGWDPAKKLPRERTESVAVSKTAQPGLAVTEVDAQFSKTELLVTDGVYRTQSEVKHAAKAQAAAVSAGYGELEAVCNGNPHLRAGTAIALDVGPQFTGKYTVNATRHRIEPFVGYTTTVVVSGGEDRTLAGLTGAAPVDRPRMPGLAIGEVTEVRKVRPLDRDAVEGQVKLRFPWLDKDYVTDWVRTVQSGGVGGGGVVSPDVNDEVLVGFEQGLLDRPYVIGGLYNGKDKPTEHDVPLVDGLGKVNRRSFSSRGGDRIELLGTKKAPEGMKLRTGDGKLTVELDRQNTKIVVHSDGSVEIEATKDVKITGRGVDINAGRGKLALTGSSVDITASSGEVSVGAFTDVALRGKIIRLN